ncbi:MAG TPA: phage minor head protein [Stellaceae bacterium]
MAEPVLQPLAPAAAIAALTNRGANLSPTFAWQDAWQDEHAAMFTVAKSAGFDILGDIHAALIDGLANGKTLPRLAANLVPILQEKGWWGRQAVIDPQTGETKIAQLGSTRRLRTIFDVNMRVSYATGHWGEFERTKATRPYLRYVAIMDGRTRPAHAARNNLTLPVDDPYWDYWAPPCGWNCRCTLQSLSERDFQNLKGNLKTTPPALDFRKYINKSTGEVVRVPNGIDPGWGYNPGRAGHLAAPAADALVAAPAPLAAAATADPAWPAARLADEFSQWVDNVMAAKPATVLGVKHEGGWVGMFGRFWRGYSRRSRVFERRR